MAVVVGALLLVSSAGATEAVNVSEMLLTDGSVVTGTDDGFTIGRDAGGGEVVGQIARARIADLPMTYGGHGVMETATLKAAPDIDHIVVDLPAHAGVTVRLGWITVGAADRRAVDQQLQTWAQAVTTVRVWVPGQPGDQITPDKYGKVTAILLGDRWQKTAFQYRLIDARFAKPAADLSALPERFAKLLAPKP